MQVTSCMIFVIARCFSPGECIQLCDGCICSPLGWCRAQCCPHSAPANWSCRLLINFNTFLPNFVMAVLTTRWIPTIPYRSNGFFRGFANRWSKSWASKRRTTMPISCASKWRRNGDIKRIELHRWNRKEQKRKLHLIEIEIYILFDHFLRFEVEKMKIHWMHLTADPCVKNWHRSFLFYSVWHQFLKQIQQLQGGGMTMNVETVYRNTA